MASGRGDTGERRVSIRDVAEAAGVSVATVSKVLRGDATVTPANRARVHEAVARLDYRVDPLAANLRRGQRSLVGVIVPDFENPFFGGVVSALEAVADAEGLTLVAMSSWESERREAALVAKMSDWRVAGLVLAPVGSGRAAVERLAALSLTAVLIDRAEEGAGFDTVTADNAAAAAEAMRALAALGHRRVTLVATDLAIPNMRERVAGAEAAAAASGIAVDVAALGLEGAAMAPALARHLDRGPRPTALFALSLLGVAPCLSVCRARGCRWPADVSLVAFDDQPWMAELDPPIAAIAQPVRALGTEAMRRLLARVAGDRGPPEARRLPCTFHPRASLGPAPAARHETARTAP